MPSFACNTICEMCGRWDFANSKGGSGNYNFNLRCLAAVYYWIASIKTGAFVSYLAWIQQRCLMHTPHKWMKKRTRVNTLHTWIINAETFASNTIQEHRKHSGMKLDCQIFLLQYIQILTCLFNVTILCQLWLSLELCLYSRFHWFLHRGRS